MPSASAIKAGETFVRMSLEAGEMEKELAKIRNKLDKFARSAVKVGATLAAIGGAGVVALSKAAQAANRVELVGRRLDAVFSETANEARKFSRELAKSIGDSRFAVEDTMVTFKSFFAEIVAGQDDQEQFSRNMTLLSRDFAAFQGMDTTEALQRFISALSGSPEVLDRFGINLKAAALDAEFAAKGLDITTESAAEFEKVVARMDIIERTMSKQGAIGKAVQELSTFSGAMRAAASAVRDFTVAVGQALLPILRPAVATFANMARGFETIATHAPALTVAFGAIVVGTAAMGVSILVAAAAATALGLAIAGISATATAYSGWAKMVKMETAGVSAQLAFAKSQLHGVGVMATQTGLRWLGMDASLKKSVATLGAVRTGLISTLSVMGKLSIVTLAFSAALGVVPSGGAGVIATLAALVIAQKLFTAALTRVKVAANIATGAMAQYTAAQYANVTATQKSAMWSAIFIDRLGGGPKALKAYTAALWLATKARIAFNFAMSPLGMAVAAIAAGVAALGLGLIQLGKEFGVGRMASEKFSKAVRTFGRDFPVVSQYMEDFGAGGEIVFNKLGKAWKAYTTIFGEGVELIKDGWATITGGATSTDKRRAQAKAEAKKTADDLLDLERGLQDARISSIKNTAARERAAMQAANQRKIQDEIATNDDLVKLREKHAEERGSLDAGDGVEGRAARQALKARQKQEMEDAIANNEAVALTRQTAAQETHNLEMKLASDLQRARMEHVNEIARLQIHATMEGSSRALALIDLEERSEIASAQRRKASEEEIARIREAAASRRSVVEIEAARSMSEARKSLEQELIDARIQGIEDAEAREVESLTQQFMRRKEATRKSEQDSFAAVKGNLVKEAQVLRFFADQRFKQGKLYEELLAQIRSKHAKQRAADDKAAAESRIKDLQSLQDEIDKLKIDLSTPEGLQRTLAQLELERKQSLRDAVGDEGQIRKINELFNLREKAAKQGAANKEVELSGGFGRQISQLGPKGSSKQEQLAEEANVLSKKQIDLIKEWIDTQQMRA